ncbi:MAG TPA: ParB/RepB/Spo0J family partition protein [Acidimicrobiales bacterium]|nr:ParB/RepB/Spo0J family partition protein [Acidimicrobiales bacterium]
MARRSGLGKGLGALIPTEVVGDRSSALREVPIGSIKPNPLQPRSHFDDDTMASLASSIKELGVLQPILVRQSGDVGAGEFELIAGERRWRAARRAGLQTIPVLIQVTDDAHSLEQALVENLHRQDLNVLEEASAYQQLIEEFDYTHDEVATRVGKSRTAVTNTLRLLQLPSGAQRLLADGQISAGHARALLGTPDRGYQETLATQIVAEGLTVRAVEEAVRARAQPDEPAQRPDLSVVADHHETDEPEQAGDEIAAAPAAPRRLPPPGLLELEELLSSHLNTRVKVDMSAKRGKVVVDFATLEDLERIYKLMVGELASTTE